MKMKITDTGAIFKNILRDSIVWYLSPREKVFYRCAVARFSAENPKPTLYCPNHDPDTVRNASWSDIFPLESHDLIKGMAPFNKSDIENPINLSKTNTYERGTQMRHWWTWAPLLFYADRKSNKFEVINSEDGTFLSFPRSEFTLIEEDDPNRIPSSTKMTFDLKYKYILRQSRVWYHQKESGRLISCSVTSIGTHKSPLSVMCGREKFNVSWKDIYPIESFELIKHLAPAYTPPSVKQLPRKRFVVSISTA